MTPIANRRKSRPFILALGGPSRFSHCRSSRLYFPLPCVPDKSFTSHSLPTSHACRNPCIIHICFSCETTSFHLPLFHQSKSSLSTPTLFVILLRSSFISSAHFGREGFCYGQGFFQGPLDTKISENFPHTLVQQTCVQIVML